jgi:hypothetical protein
MGPTTAVRCARPASPSSPLNGDTRSQLGTVERSTEKGAASAGASARLRVNRQRAWAASDTFSTRPNRANGAQW